MEVTVSFVPRSTQHLAHSGRELGSMLLVPPPSDSSKLDIVSLPLVRKAKHRFPFCGVFLF